VVIGPVSFMGENPYVDMAVTATDDINLPAGLLLVRVDLTQLWNTTLDIRVGNTGYAYLVDSGGRLVAARNRRLLGPGGKLLELAGRTPQTIATTTPSFYTSIAGDVVLGSTRPLKTVPWFAVVEQPLREALAPMILPALALLALLGLVCLLLRSTVRFAHVRIVVPLLDVRDAVGKMAAGQLNQSVLVRQNDELGQLGHSLNQMAAQLQQAFLDLENQVFVLNQTQAALRESDEKFRLIAENIHEVFWIFDVATRRVIYASPAYETIWGRAGPSLLANPRDWLEAIHPEDRARVAGAHSAQVNIGTAYHERYRIVRPDGTIRWIEDQGFPVRASNGVMVRIVGTAADITESRELEQRVRQKQKNEAIGTLAEGIAHDFNNILAGITGFGSLARLVAGNNPELLDYLGEIDRGSQRAVGLVR
jgi:PAS domain S-box-containing protein